MTDDTNRTSPPPRPREIIRVDMDAFYASVEQREGRTVTLKVKFNDFGIITRSKSLPDAASSRSELERNSIDLLRNEVPLPKPVRLLWDSLSSLQADDQEEPQLDLPL